MRLLLSQCEQPDGVSSAPLPPLARIPSLGEWSWILLVLAGLLETGWAVTLKYTDGFTKPLPSLLTAGMLVGSVMLLSIAARALPIGTAYAVWVGIGALGAATLGIVLLGEPATGPRIFFLALLLLSIVGLKLTSP